MGNSLIKLTRRNRNNDNENQPSSSPIFKLNNHCFDELFDYLSLKDLHSLGQTCKSMQQMTGNFFKLNYSAAKIMCLSDGIYTTYDDYDRNTKCIPLRGFIQFITSIAIESNIEKETKCKAPVIYTIYYNDLTIKLNYIKLHANEMQLVKKLYLTYLDLNPQNVDYILKILPNIEVLEFGYSEVNHDFYDIFLKYCMNLRRIQLINIKFENSYKWLLQRYEKLEHLYLGVIDQLERIDELGIFFERNPNLCSFSCDLFILWSNKDIFLNSKIKLDTFELIYIDVKYYRWDHSLDIPLWNFLHQLHTNGFYKRLHISSTSDLDLRFDQLPVTQFLDKLFIRICDDNLELLSTHFIECTEIYLTHYREKKFMKNLINVEYLYLNRELADILLIIQQLKNLKKLKLMDFKSDEILKLDLLNAEREKLDGAQKITIYVPDAIYLATKWATKNGATNFNFIQMKRIDSYEWNRYIYCRVRPTYWNLRKKQKYSQILNLFK